MGKEYFRWDYFELPFIASSAAIELDNLYRQPKLNNDSEPIETICTLLSNTAELMRERDFVDPATFAILYGVLTPNGKKRNYRSLADEVDRFCEKMKRFPNISREESEELRNICVAASKSLMRYRCVAGR